VKKRNAEQAAESGARRPQRRFDRTEIIIDAAAEIFRRKGYDATSLQEIADEVGILKGSIYHYIDTKEDLLFAIIERNHARIIEGNQAWREEDDVVEAIRAFIDGHIRQSLLSPTDSIVFVRDFRALSPERAELITKRQADYDKEFRDLVKRAISDGRLREGVTPAYAARAVFGMSNWVHYWYHADGKAKADAVADELSTYALASLLAPVPPRG
jgi:TetR/AcrR family transcriptional regulator, cholesterol catabolism regulator